MHISSEDESEDEIDHSASELEEVDVQEEEVDVQEAVGALVIYRS